MKNIVWSNEELATIRNVDRLLPSQPHLRKLYTGESKNFFGDLERVLLSVHDFVSVEEKWKLELKDGVTYASLGADINTLYFYQFIVNSVGIKTVLELGTYVGVSALFWAEAVGDSGEVTTVEIGQEFHEIAKANIQSNRMENRVKQILGSAPDVMLSFVKSGKKFDCIFIDAAKEIYDELFEQSLKCLAKGGVILVDDILFQGEMLNTGKASEKGAGVQKTIDLAKNTKGFKTILPIGNGLLMIKPDLL